MESIAAPQTLSAKSLYDEVWHIFWCGGHKTPPLAAHSSDRGFLSYLFCDKQLAPGKVPSFQTAIAYAFKHTGLSDVGHNPALTALLTSFLRECLEGSGFFLGGTFLWSSCPHQSSLGAPVTNCTLGWKVFFLDLLSWPEGANSTL